MSKQSSRCFRIDVAVACLGLCSFIRGICLSDRRAKCFSDDEEATAAFRAVIRQPDVMLFKRSQRIAAEVVPSFFYHSRSVIINMSLLYLCKFF